MPAAFERLAAGAAAEAGFEGFVPEACLVNRDVPGARLSLHQDRDERDFDAPILSVSLCLPATFLFGGTARADKPARPPLAHGDDAVPRGLARLRHPGALPPHDAEHPLPHHHPLPFTFRPPALPRQPATH